MEIFDLKSFKASADGRLISVTFETESEPLEIVVNTRTLTSIIQQLAGVVWEAQRSDPSTILSIPTPSQVQVQPAKNHDGVVMRFLMSNKLEYLFALATQDAKVLRSLFDHALG